jgi:hypothetical protein
MIKKGSTRWVIQFKSIVIKIPSFRNWKDFLYGLIHNMEENRWSKWNDNYDNVFCPVLFSFPGGFFNIMPYCYSLTGIEFKDIDFSDYKDLPVENKHDSFGWYQDKIVVIDYH